MRALKTLTVLCIIAATACGTETSAKEKKDKKLGVGAGQANVPQTTTESPAASGDVVASNDQATGDVKIEIPFLDETVKGVLVSTLQKSACRPDFSIGQKMQKAEQALMQEGQAASPDEMRQKMEKIIAERSKLEAADRKRIDACVKKNPGSEAFLEQAMQIMESCMMAPQQPEEPAEGRVSPSREEMERLMRESNEKKAKSQECKDALAAAQK